MTYPLIVLATLSIKVSYTPILTEDRHKEFFNFKWRNKIYSKANLLILISSTGRDFSMSEWSTLALTEHFNVPSTLCFVGCTLDGKANKRLTDFAFLRHSYIGLPKKAPYAFQRFYQKIQYHQMSKRDYHLENKKKKEIERKYKRS